MARPARRWSGPPSVATRWRCRFGDPAADLTRVLGQVLARHDRMSGRTVLTCRRPSTSSVAPARGKCAAGRESSGPRSNNRAGSRCPSVSNSPSGATTPTGREAPARRHRPAIFAQRMHDHRSVLVPWTYIDTICGRRERCRVDLRTPEHGCGPPVCGPAAYLSTDPARRRVIPVRTPNGFALHALGRMMTTGPWSAGKSSAGAAVPLPINDQDPAVQHLTDSTLHQLSTITGRPLHQLGTLTSSAASAARRATGSARRRPTSWQVTQSRKSVQI